MHLNEYQHLAERTINRDLFQYQNELHALHGLASEIGEIHALYQKVYQGHIFDKAHLQKEIGDLLWFIAELCTINDLKLSDVAQMNIDKLKARYPEGFEISRSLHRKDGDI